LNVKTFQGLDTCDFNVSPFKELQAQ
jgi:hypothetical protein